MAVSEIGAFCVGVMVAEFYGAALGVISQCSNSVGGQRRACVGLDVVPSIWTNLFQVLDTCPSIHFGDVFGF